MERSSKPVVEVVRPDGERAEVKQDGRRDRPAKTFENGRVVTRVWANRTAWGEVDWSVDQVRFFSRQAGSRYTHTFQAEDLMDCMRGMNRARTWVRRRGPWWRRLVPFL